MKRLLTLFVALALFATACGGGTNDDTAVEADAPASESVDTGDGNDETTADDGAMDDEEPTGDTVEVIEEDLSLIHI